ncbi:MAG: hypothetical protein QHH05_06515 [Syntrophomonadaceae bacterium]|jgi:hypothetical protein|nr:hypothetical protein [Syntrophomonadaceae bacterium]MDH7498082.1 hypothetical protein [Syntrophomonadaceae bacterium]
MSTTWVWVGAAALAVLAAVQAMVFWRRHQRQRQALEDRGVYSMPRGEGRLFFPASVSYYRSLYVGPEGIEAETAGRPLAIPWEQVVSVRQELNADRKTLRDTYQLVISLQGRPRPVFVQLGSFRDEEVRAIVKEIAKRVRVTR